MSNNLPPLVSLPTVPDKSALMEHQTSGVVVTAATLSLNSSSLSTITTPTTSSTIVVLPQKLGNSSAASQKKSKRGHNSKSGGGPTATKRKMSSKSSSNSGQSLVLNGQPVILQPTSPVHFAQASSLSSPISTLVGSSSNTQTQVQISPQLQQVLTQGVIQKSSGQTPTTILMQNPTRLTTNSQQYATQIRRQSLEEERMLRYGKAILKLKKYRRNLKYAIWDFQDGKDLTESSKIHQIPEDSLKYSIDMIINKTGDTIEKFRENKSLACDEHLGPKSEEYISRLRESAVAFKQNKCGSLFFHAKQKSVSLFDLIDELTKELEIESKLYRLTPVEPSKLQMFNSASASTSANKQHQIVSAVITNKDNNGSIPTTATFMSLQPTPPQQPSQQLSSATPNVNPPAYPGISTISISNAIQTSPPALITSNIPANIIQQAVVTPLTSMTPLSTPSSSVYITADDSEASILSDIEEVIRDDTNHNSVMIQSPPANLPQQIVLQQSQPAQNQLQINNPMVLPIDDSNVVMLNICGVCHKVFTDENLYHEHEAAGCLDF